MKSPLVRSWTVAIVSIVAGVHAMLAHVAQAPSPAATRTAFLQLIDQPRVALNPTVAPRRDGEFLVEEIGCGSIFSRTRGNQVTAEADRAMLDWFQRWLRAN